MATDNEEYVLTQSNTEYLQNLQGKHLQYTEQEPGHN